MLNLAFDPWQMRMALHLCRCCYVSCYMYCHTWVCVWKVWLARQMYMYTEWSTWPCSCVDVMIVSLCIHTCVSFCFDVASLVNDSSGERVSTNNLLGLMKEVRRYTYSPLSLSLLFSSHPLHNNIMICVLRVAHMFNSVFTSIWQLKGTLSTNN